MFHFDKVSGKLWVESMYLLRVRVCSLTLLLLRKSPVVVHYLQHLQEFLQILSGEERHILDIVQADVCSDVILQHRNGVEWFCRLWHLPTTKVSLQFIGLFSCTVITCFCGCPLLGMSFNWCEPKAQHDLCARHVEASFARLAQRGITGDASASASLVLDEFVPIEGWGLLLLFWCFFPIFLVDHLI